MAEKDKKKLKVILKLPKFSSSPVKSPATAAEDEPSSSALAFPVAHPAQSARTADQRASNVQPRPSAAPSPGTLITHSTAPSSSLVRSNGSKPAPSADPAVEVRLPALPSSTPPRKRKFKSVEDAGASRPGGSILGASSPADTSRSGKDVTKDGVRMSLDEKPSAIAVARSSEAGAGAGVGVGRSGEAGAGAGARAETGAGERRVGASVGSVPEASPKKKSHKKAENSGVQRLGRQRHVPGADVHTQASLESVAKPLLEGIVDKLQKKDTYGVFAEPVDAAQVPDYYDIIKDPMDFGTMKKKIKKGIYTSVDLFEADILLICNNAMRYNGPETIYFRQAKGIRDMARRALDGIRAQLTGDPPKSAVSKKVSTPKKLHTKKPAGIKLRLEGSILEFSSGAILRGDGGHREGSNSTGDAANVEKGSSSVDIAGTRELAVRSTDASTGIESKAVAREDASGRPMGPKDGRRPLSTEENHRTTYKRRQLSARGQGPPLAGVGGELYRLIPMVNRDEHAYTQSLAQFGALLGQKAWRIVAKKLANIHTVSTTSVTKSVINHVPPAGGGAEKKLSAPQQDVILVDTIS